jgi:predicted O-linked N-acetylglucosamine transferase (SPINDLY family)/glycosyltransferase involved in cell wall biosynthesis
MSNKSKFRAKSPGKRAESPRILAVEAGVGAWDIVRLMSEVQSLDPARVPSEGISMYRQWLAVNGNSPVRFAALFNLGVILAACGQREEAIRVYSEALEIQPYLGEARINLGLAYEVLERKDEAVAEWRKLIDDPVAVATVSLEVRCLAHNHIGRLLEILHQYEPSEQILWQSLLLNPKQTDVLQHWFHLRQKQCRWPVEVDVPGGTGGEMLLSLSPLAMLAHSDDPRMQLLTSIAFAQRKFNTIGGNLSAGRKYAHRRLRIGYLSSDFLTHAVGLLLAEVFESHDRTRVETYGFCVSKEDGSVQRARLIAGLEHFEKVGHLSDEAIARRILECEIDVLVDLNGMSLGTRIGVLSYRPAPVQATWLGFIGPTSLPYVDYVITDRFAIPEELAKFYREKPLYLSGSFLPRDNKREIGAQTTRAKHGLPEGVFVFASFNNIYKINPTMFGTWMRILNRVPGSVLWLLDDNPWATAHLRAFAESCGVDSKRLIFAGRVMPPDHLARLKLADLFLDNHPYNAGSTANDVLMVGLPLLTLSGRTFVSRMGGSVLTAMGFSELITFHHGEYEERAVSLATGGELAGIRARLDERNRMSRPTAAKRFAEGLEEGLAKVAGFALQPSVGVGVAVPKKRDGRKSLLVRGWRDINHSFSLVNQFQLIELIKREDIQLFHEDLPYASTAWSPAQNGSGFPREVADRIADIPPYRGEELDAVLSISSPFSLFTGSASRVVTFMVTEFGVDSGSFVPGSPPPAAFTEGRNWVVTPSNWSKSKLVSAGMDPAKVVVVPHGVDCEIFRPLVPDERALVRKQLNCEPDDFVLLNIGGAFWNKGGDLLLRAFAELRKEFGHLRLVIKDNRTLYGRTTDEMVADLEGRHPGLFTAEVLAGITMLPTAMGMEQLRLLYGAADLYVSPYRAEGFNLPVLESMSCRTRVLMTGGGATDDFYHPGLCEKIIACPMTPEQSGVPTKGDYLEPDYEDLKHKIVGALMRGKAALDCREEELADFFKKWSWGEATGQLASICGVNAESFIAKV